MAITFISHSSAKTEEDQANADSVRTELIKRLPEFGWEVRVDDNLPPGMAWRSILHTWMADCDAAVVLVNRDGLESTWLKREVNILLWRQSVGSRLTIVPVLLRGLTPRELRRSEISHLADLQCIMQDDTGSEDLVSVVLGRLGRLRTCADTSAMRSMTAKIEHCLDGVSDRFTLRAMARKLGAEEDWGFPTAEEEIRHIAHQCLAPVPVQKVPSAVDEVEFFLALDRLDKLISLLLPTWIDPIAVRLLLPGDGQVVATLAGRRADTARQHIARASCSSGRYRAEAVSLVAGEAQDAEHREACLTAVRALLWSDDENDLPFEDHVLFLVIDPAGTELGVVGQLVQYLTERFAWLNIVVLTDGDDPVALGTQTARTLHIPLQPCAERQAERAGRALDGIRAQHTGRGKGQAS